MLVSHESPICLLEESRKYNDYDYALIHLFEQIPEYYNFFKESLKQGRIVYLDNSIFELGKAFDSTKFANICEEFYKINKNNFYYIIPDSLENKDETIQQFKDFSFKQGNKIGVVQGKTFDEINDCFEFMKENADIVAISFDYSYYLNTSGNNKYEKFMNGRIELINKLNIKDTKIHLLGCSLPQEFYAYKNIPEIISCDTSNPIVHGILGIKYNNGLMNKESIKLVDLIHSDLNNNKDIIYYNIKKFKDFTK